MKNVDDYRNRKVGGEIGVEEAVIVVSIVGLFE